MARQASGLTDQQLAALIERGRGWPWNGYELRLTRGGRQVSAKAIRHSANNARWNRRRLQASDIVGGEVKPEAQEVALAILARVQERGGFVNRLATRKH
jgi:hypothetical protein